jgi:hypothetical protein
MGHSTTKRIKSLSNDTYNIKIKIVPKFNGFILHQSRFQSTGDITFSVLEIDNMSPIYLKLTGFWSFL